MKRFAKLFALVIALTSVMLLAGCGTKRTDLKFDGEEGSITFSVKDSSYKISTDKKDLRTSREQGSLVGDNFKIGIEFNDDFGYFFKGDFEELKKARMDRDDYKEVTYSGIKGIQYFYGGYNCYNIILPVKGSKDYFVELSVYGKKDTEASAKEAIKSDEVQDVLNNISNITAKK